MATTKTKPAAKLVLDGTTGELKVKKPRATKVKVEAAKQETTTEQPKEAVENTSKPAEKLPKARPAAKKAQSKMDLATAVYTKMKDKPRQDVLAAFMTKAGLTKAGAATYLSLIKAKLAA